MPPRTRGRRRGAAQCSSPDQPVFCGVVGLRPPVRWVVDRLTSPLGWRGSRGSFPLPPSALAPAGDLAGFFLALFAAFSGFSSSAASPFAAFVGFGAAFPAAPRLAGLA